MEVHAPKGTQSGVAYTHTHNKNRIIDHAQKRSFVPLPVGTVPGNAAHDSWQVPSYKYMSLVHAEHDAIVGYTVQPTQSDIIEQSHGTDRSSLAARPAHSKAHMRSLVDEPTG